MRRLSLIVGLWCAASLTFCADEATDKGEEEDDYTSFEEAADTWSQPTDHGELFFGLAQSGDLTDDTLYHTWNFTLSDQATVTISIAPVTPNLDTVLYLYRFNDESGLWGRYIAKNDDHDGGLGSELSRSLEAGVYRILVKGHKRAIRGSFSVNAVCDGAGCEAPTGECTPDNFLPLPHGADISCGEAMSAAMSGAAQSSGGTNIALAEHCSLPDYARLGFDWYYSYWEDIAGFHDMFDWAEEYGIDVEWTLYDNGSAYVGVDAGGDEAAMDFLINADGEMVAYYQHNQSPDFGLNCEGGSTWGDEECGRIYMSAFLPDDASDLGNGAEQGVTEADARERLDPVSFLAFDAYRRELELQADAQITVTFDTWENQGYGDWEAAGRVTVEADGQAAFHYELATASTTQWLFTLKRGDATRAYTCTEM